MFKKVVYDDVKRKRVMFVLLYKWEEDGFVLILMSFDIEYLMIVFIEKLCLFVIDDNFLMLKIFFKIDGVLFYKGIIGR